MIDKDKIAAQLIQWHFEVESGLQDVYRIINANENDPKEPIKLIEVNVETVSTGRLEAFGFAPTREIPYPTLIAEVTPNEFEELCRFNRFPAGWEIVGAKHFSRSAA